MQKKKLIKPLIKVILLIGLFLLSSFLFLPTINKVEAYTGTGPEPNQYNKNQQENFYYFNGGFAVTYILNDNELPNDGRSERARKYWSNSSPKKRWQ